MKVRQHAGGRAGQGVAYVVPRLLDPHNASVTVVSPIPFLPYCMQARKTKLLDVRAMVLANLCVAYIMTSANEEAEEVMRLVEAAEEEAIAVDPDTQVREGWHRSGEHQQRQRVAVGTAADGLHARMPPRTILPPRLAICHPAAALQVFHLCIINLVIGTLYCSKGNYEFGVSRVIKSLVRLRVHACMRAWRTTVCCCCCASMRVKRPALHSTLG